MLLNFLETDCSVNAALLWFHAFKDSALTCWARNFPMKRMQYAKGTFLLVSDLIALNNKTNCSIFKL